MEEGEPSIPQLKRQLEQELGPEKFASYLGLLREWFGQRLTKHMFDYEVEELLSDVGFILHNQLLHTVLLQCYAGFIGRSASSLGSVPGSQLSKQSVNSAALANSTSTKVDHEERDDNGNIYIIPPAPGEEPFIYPANAVDYPVGSNEAPPEIDLMEQDAPPDCDWLQEVKLNYHEDDTDAPEISMKNRFPPWFADEFQRVKKNYALDVNIVHNVTHLLYIRDILEKRPHLKQHFVVPDENTPYLTSGCSLYGRILVKAWYHNVQNVNQLVTEYAVKAVKDNIKNIIVAILKQRRSFRMRDKRILHSVGVPCPNPYLRQAYHLYDEAYGSDTTKMADVVMQVPTPFPTLEEKERLAALQVASSCSPRDSRFISEKGTMMDFRYALEQNPSLIPSKRTRFKLLDFILQSSKGFTGSQNSQYHCEDEDDAISQYTSQTLPVVSY